MVDFNDVRRESEPTFFFFASSLRLAFEYALKECQITGWQIMTRKEALQYLPEDFVIPEVRISPGAPRVEKAVLVFVSHYNQSDIARKFEGIQYDSDVRAWLNAGGERLMKDCRREDKFLKDPAPFYPFAGSTREEDKAQIEGVRRGKEPTFFWFSRQHEADLVHYLEKHDITGWEIITDLEGVQNYLPEGANIPDVPDIAVMVSYFDPADMERKLTEILSNEDNIAWRLKNIEASIRMQEYRQRWLNDPPPFPDGKYQERV